MWTVPDGTGAEDERIKRSLFLFFLIAKKEDMWIFALVGLRHLVCISHSKNVDT